MAWRGGAGQGRTIGWLWLYSQDGHPGLTLAHTPAHAARTASSGISLSRRKARRKESEGKKSARELPPPSSTPTCWWILFSWLASHHCPLTTGENTNGKEKLRTEFPNPQPRSLALASQRRLPTNLRSAGHQCRNSRGRARRRGRCDGRRTHECDDAGCQIVLYLTLPELI